MPKNVTQTLMGADMYITDYKFYDREKLKEQIVKDVKDTQIFAGRNLPDKLYMYFDQFTLLQDDMQEMANTEMRIYVTPLNVMEVHIVDTPEFVDIEALTGEEDKDGKALQEQIDTVLEARGE